MRSTWDPHLVAIEQGAVLGRRKRRFPAAQRKGEECPWWSGGPGVPPSLHQLGGDAFTRGAKAPKSALLLCWHRWSLSLGMCSILPWAEPPHSPAAPLSARRGAQAPHGRCAWLSWLCWPSQPHACSLPSSLVLTRVKVKTLLLTVWGQDNSPHAQTPPCFSFPLNLLWEQKRSPDEVVKVARSRQGMLSRCDAWMGTRQGLHLGPHQCRQLCWGQAVCLVLCSLDPSIPKQPRLLQGFRVALLGEHPRTAKPCDSKPWLQVKPGKDI